MTAIEAVDIASRDGVVRAVTLHGINEKLGFIRDGRFGAERNTGFDHESRIPMPRKTQRNSSARDRRRR